MKLGMCIFSVNTNISIEWWSNEMQVCCYITVLILAHEFERGLKSIRP